MDGYFNFNSLKDRAASFASTQDNNSDSGGRRVRLRPKPRAFADIIGNGNILRPLALTNGMVWPYQPQIGYSQEVDYTNVSMVHTNQDFYAYTRTPSVKLTCEGEFTVQNQTEGLYAMACIHFLRTVTKMYFGETPVNIGTPPPILLFDAYGEYMFNKLPVIVTNFTANMPKDVDYVRVKNPGENRDPSLQPINLIGNILNASPAIAGDVWLPAVFSISVSMTVQNTPARLRQFNLEQFRSGNALKDGGWV